MGHTVVDWFKTNRVPQLWYYGLWCVRTIQVATTHLTWTRCMLSVNVLSAGSLVRADNTASICSWPDIIITLCPPSLRICGKWKVSKCCASTNALESVLPFCKQSINKQKQNTYQNITVTITYDTNYISDHEMTQQSNYGIQYTIYCVCSTKGKNHKIYSKLIDRLCTGFSASQWMTPMKRVCSVTISDSISVDLSKIAISY